ncbi:O-antigen ligase family protein [Thalassotalea sediminis]|uniref:O-antigen ligase family protein n=1 Tax=Thalassotalea sediminis TaxID=1759089 RepID=UPI0025724A10|nr:O-antigen ligase family protein [Thalassotalea sediminis]
MGYFVLLLTIVVYLIRPAEWIPALYFNWNMLLNILGILVMLGVALNQNRKFTYDRTTLFLLWFIFAMILSNLFNGQFNTISGYISQILSTLIIFVLTQTAITRPKQIDNFILVIILVVLFICFQCYLQATVGYNWGGLEPFTRGLVSQSGVEEAAREIQVVWYGVLQDPNDLGMLLIAFMPYIFSRVFYQKIDFIKKCFWIIAMLIIGYTVILTNSRGSMLSLIGGLAFFYIIKKRSMTGYVLASIAGLALLAIAPSRMAELGSGDYSAMGRVYAWILALELLAMNPIFGIGAKHFLDYHALTTHNSYVLAMVENGIIGFIGYFSIFAITVFTTVKVAYTVEDKRRSIEIIALVSGMVGILISIFFISRTYALLPFLYVAIVMTYLRVHTPELFNEYISKLKLFKLVVLSGFFIIGLYIFNRLATAILI